MGKTLYDKVWDRHEVTLLEDGRSQLFIGLHLVHEVTSPQAFGMLKEKGLKVAFPERTFATLDHIIPTDGAERPFQDSRLRRWLPSRRIPRNMVLHSLTVPVVTKALCMSWARS